MCARRRLSRRREVGGQTPHRHASRPVVAGAEGLQETPALWVQVTDFDVHALWVHEHVERYCAANEEVAFRLADRGVPREKISVTGIPVMPQFGALLDRTTCAKELHIAADKFTVLMMAGGAGVGFTTTVERVMTAADLVVTKPGGLSVSECLAKCKPMLLVSPIPGQEERNADYLLEAGAAIKAVDGATLEFKLARLIGDPARLKARGDGAYRAPARGRGGRCADIAVQMKIWISLDVAQHPALRAIGRRRQTARGHCRVDGLDQHCHRQLMIGAAENHAA